MNLLIKFLSDFNSPCTGDGCSSSLSGAEHIQEILLIIMVILIIIYLIFSRNKDEEDA